MTLPFSDAALVQIMDAALADATRRAGAWLSCRPGCNQCCTGVFRISQLDAARLRAGLQALEATDTEKARALRKRIEETRQQLSAGFPGDQETGRLGAGEEDLDAFEEFADDQVCPVLDPEAGTCSLYLHRPMTCRTFGPPVQTNDGEFGVCELCFVGATPAEVAAAQLHMPAPALEISLAEHLGADGETIVAFAFQYQV